MLHLFALIHANFAQLMYHCSSEGSHWRFNYLVHFGVCVCLCCIVGMHEYGRGWILCYTQFVFVGLIVTVCVCVSVYQLSLPGLPDTGLIVCDCRLSHTHLN